MQFTFGIFFQKQTKLLPLELISGYHVPNYTHLQCLHVWGCPTFVLDQRLQDGKKLPKWSPRSRLGCFMGYSCSHSSSVSLILNMKTGSVTLQYHLVHDNWFSTVSNAMSSTLPKSLWNDLISCGYEREKYELSNSCDTWLGCEASTSREKAVRNKKELNTSNHSYGETSSDEEANTLVPEGASTTHPEGARPVGANTTFPEGARQTRTRTVRPNPRYF